MVKSRIPAIAATLDARVTAAIRVAAEGVEREAKSRVPVASGDLRDSIHTETDGDDVYIVAGNDNVFYGHFVELGTTRTPARPFLVPALEARRELIVGAVTAVLRGL